MSDAERLILEGITDNPLLQAAEKMNVSSTNVIHITMLMRILCYPVLSKWKELSQLFCWKTHIFFFSFSFESLSELLEAKKKPVSCEHNLIYEPGILREAVWLSGILSDCPVTKFWLNNFLNHCKLWCSHWRSWGDNSIHFNVRFKFIKESLGDLIPVSRHCFWISDKEEMCLY